MVDSADELGMREAVERLKANGSLARRSKDLPHTAKFPTAVALVMARAAKRVGMKHGDLGLVRAANSLQKRAVDSLKKKQSVLSNPPSTNSDDAA